MNINIEIIERFHEKWTLSSNGCWEWIAAQAGPMGYGSIKIPNTRKQVYAHRLSYMIHYGPIGDGEYICHSCDNPLCVKPSHLFPGSIKDNLCDMKAKGRHLYGARNGQAKLTDEKVRQIHRLHAEGLSMGKIGKSCGVTQTTIF